MPMLDQPKRDPREVDLDADLSAVPDVFCDRCSSIANPKTYATYAELSAHRAKMHADRKPASEPKEPVMEFQMTEWRRYGDEKEVVMVDATPWMVRHWFTDLRRH